MGTCLSRIVRLRCARHNDITSSTAPVRAVHQELGVCTQSREFISPGWRPFLRQEPGGDVGTAKGRTRVTSSWRNLSDMDQTAKWPAPSKRTNSLCGDWMVSK